MKITDIYIGQIVYTFDLHKEEFISFEVESITKVNTDIMVNGRFGIEDVFETVNEAYIKICDDETQEYRATIRNLMMKYNDFNKKPIQTISNQADEIFRELAEKWSDEDDK